MSRFISSQELILELHVIIPWELFEYIYSCQLYIN